MSITQEQQEYLESVGYNYIQPRYKQLTKQEQLDKQTKQMENLQKIQQNKQQELEQLKRKNEEDTQKRLKQQQQKLNEKLAFTREQHELKKKHKQQISEQIQKKDEQYQNYKKALEFNVILHETKLTQLMNRKYEEKLSAIELGKKKDEQNRIKSNLAKQIKNQKEQIAQMNWENWVRRAKTQRKFDEEEQKQSIQICFGVEHDDYIPNQIVEEPQFQFMDGDFQW
ncbi:Hypothetical_protein [Hexamita inflata]|uniref:Hypothetical_protein n=1 Tax=Hexamita inflata TaxID=28002 RepID=A0AA86PKU8_9EUKA|nr:Hypothetical protein HINF_LOCUS27973 [Hexamita inflata]